MLVNTETALPTVVCPFCGGKMHPEMGWRYDVGVSFLYWRCVDRGHISGGCSAPRLIEEPSPRPA